MKVTVRDNGKFCTIKVFGKRIAIHRDACVFCATQDTPLDFYDK